MEGLNGGLSAFFAFHGDKSKAARLAAEFVHDQIHFGDCAVRSEEILELIFCGVEGKISYKQFRAHDEFSNLDSTALSQTVPDHRVSNHH